MSQPGLYQSLHPFSHTRWFLMVFFFFNIYFYLLVWLRWVFVFARGIFGLC